MKINKILLMLVVLLATFLLVSASSAADVDSTVVSEDASINQVDSVDILEVKTEVSGFNEDLTNLKGTEDDFTTLNEIIQNCPEGGEITLNNSYIFNPNADSAFIDGIDINKSIKINGNGNYINASDSARIFNIISDNVEINTISLIQANDGAIYWSGDNGNLNNCIIYESDAKEGGTIYWSGDNGSFVNGRVIQCAINSGVGIYWSGDNGIVEDINVMATGGEGIGAIHWSGDKGILRFCDLQMSGSDYGAVYWDGDNGTVDGICCYNFGDSIDGGAIYWNNSVNGVVKNCIFESIFAMVEYGANNNGGAIYCNNVSNFIIEDSTFTEITAGNLGGAIFFNYGDGQIINCTFDRCSATNGGAIYWVGQDGHITDCSFSDNLAKDEGNSIFVNAPGIYIYNNKFSQTNEDGSDCEIYLSNNATEADLIENTMLTLSPDVGYAAVHIDCGDQFGDWADAFLNGNDFKNNCIWNDGEITSPIKMVFDSKVVKKGETAVITGTIYDDNGNYIITTADIFAYLNDDRSNRYKGDLCDLFYYFYIPTKDLKPGVYKFSSSIDEENDHVTFEGNLIVLPADNPNPNPNPNKKGIPMEATGNPLVVLLVGLATIGLGSLKRKL